MSTIKEAAADFLACRRIAVTGVSREPKDHGGNIVFTRLKERGYDVFAVNPNTDTVEGVRAHPDLGSIPGGVEAVVIATAPSTPRPPCARPATSGYQGLDAPLVRRRQRLRAATEFGRAHGMA